jgi:hypothetical protein
MSNNDFSYLNNEINLEDPVVENTPEIEDPIISIDEPVKADSEKKDSSDSVVVYALRDLSKSGATNLTKGYNTLTKGQYKKWEGSAAVRLASKDEVEKYVN